MLRQWRFLKIQVGDEVWRRRSLSFDLRLSGRGLPSLPARAAALSRPSPTDLSAGRASLGSPLRLKITRVRSMGDDKFIDKSVSDESATPQQQWAADDKAKANGSADWKPTPKQLVQRDEFAGRFAKLFAEKKRKAEQAETKAEAEGETKHRHLLIDPDDLDTVISTKWLIDGLVPLQEITVWSSGRQKISKRSWCWRFCSVRRPGGSSSAGRFTGPKCSTSLVKVPTHSLAGSRLGRN